MNNLTLSDPSMLGALKTHLKEYGVNGFCFHLPLENNSISDLDLQQLKDFRPELVKREQAVIASDKRAVRVREYYFHQFSSKPDSGLTKKKKLGPNLWEGPDLSCPSGQQFHRFLVENHVSHVVNWLVPLHVPWTGMFNLFATGDRESLMKVITENHDIIHRTLMLYGNYFASECLAELNPIANHGLLSKKALKVLKWVSEGRPVEEIGELENLSIRGVCYHIDRIKCILKSQNRSHLIHKATRLGLI